MKTFLAFAPSARGAFQFQVALDGATYTAVVLWNVYRQDYYVTVATLQGDVVFNVPLVGSPVGYDISLTAGYFATPLVWRPVNGWFEIG